MGFQFVAQPTAEIALAAATAKTVLQVRAAANHRVKVLAWGVFFDGTTSGNEPVVVTLERQTTDGTMTTLSAGSGLNKWDDSIGDTVDSTAAHTATAEPTSGDLLALRNVHPQSGYEMVYPMGQEPIIGAGDRVGIKCTAPDVVNVIPYLLCEE